MTRLRFRSRSFRLGFGFDWDRFDAALASIGIDMGLRWLGFGFDRDRFGSASVSIAIPSDRLRLRSRSIWDRGDSASGSIAIVSARLRFRLGSLRRDFGFDHDRYWIALPRRRF